MKDNFISSKYLPNNSVHEMKSSSRFNLLHVIRDILAVLGSI